MHLSRRAFLAGMGAAAVPQAIGAQTDTPFGPGAHALGSSNDRDGLVYVPRAYRTGTPAPLLLMLHGAGGSSASAARWYPLADEFGVVLLAPDSRDERTWDMILGGFGPDVDFIATALASVRRRCSIDGARMVIAGFSDGASYALSLGIGTGDVFGRIIAFSPGVMQPDKARGKPPVFISHGTADGVIPIDASSRRFVPRLKALGYAVTYREFDGRHTVPDAIAREAWEWAFGASRK